MGRGGLTKARLRNGMPAVTQGKWVKGAGHSGNTCSQRLAWYLTDPLTSQQQRGVFLSWDIGVSWGGHLLCPQ